MNIQSFDYYRQRAEQELAAADRAGDPAIAHIHRQLARRYRELADGDHSRASFGEAGPALA